MRSSGKKNDGFLIQNQTKSIGNERTPSRCQSVQESQPASTQYRVSTLRPPPVNMTTGTLVPPAQAVLFTGGHIQCKTGMARTSAGMKKATHSRRRLKIAQKAASATTVP